MQEADAERRMQILRGEIPSALRIEDKAMDESEGRRQASRGESQRPGGEKKRRKKVGENDTEYEMRLAHEKSNFSPVEKKIMLRKPIDAPLVDHSGHIDLFPQDRNNKPVEKNIEAEKEATKKKREYEDQYTMRFSNAAGFKQGLENPWYSRPSAAKDELTEHMPSKDVWGNEDPRRKEREVARVVSSDPLAIMRQGAAQARQVEKERKLWREEREKELSALLEAEEHRGKRKRRYEDDNEDTLDDFRLDGSESRSSRRHGEHDRDRSHRHTHKDSRRQSHRREGSRHRHRLRVSQ